MLFAFIAVHRICHKYWENYFFNQSCLQSMKFTLLSVIIYLMFIILTYVHSYYELFCIEQLLQAKV